LQLEPDGQQVAPQQRPAAQQTFPPAQQSCPGAQTALPQQVLPGTWHAPLQQMPSRQMRPPVPSQPPQWLGSNWVSTHCPPHFVFPRGHVLRVQVQVSPSRDLLRLQAGTHFPPHLPVPAGHDSHPASAVTSRWCDRRRPPCCEAIPTGQASTHLPSAQVCSAPQQLLVPHRVVPVAQADWHRSLMHSWSLEQQVSPQRDVPAGQGLRQPSGPHSRPTRQQRALAQQISCENSLWAQQFQPPAPLPQQMVCGGQ